MGLDCLLNSKIAEYSFINFCNIQSPQILNRTEIWKAQLGGQELLFFVQAFTSLLLMHCE